MAETGGVQSLERAFGLLEALSRRPRGMQLGELVAESGLHKSTVHRLLASLTAQGYVRRGEEGRYHLSLKLFEMAGRIVEDIDVLEVARATLERLRDSAKEAVHLVVRDGCDIVYVHKAENTEGSYQMFSRIGARRPLYCTAAGKAILAALGDREVARVWEQSAVERYTEHTITSLDELYRELDETRARGYALDNEENELGVRCIAAGIRDFAGLCRAAFSVSAPVVRMPDTRLAELAPLVLESAGKISAGMGYRGRP